jgi:hypothetical protein
MCASLDFTQSLHYNSFFEALIFNFTKGRRCVNQHYICDDTEIESNPTF